MADSRAHYEGCPHDECVRGDCYGECMNAVSNIGGPRSGSSSMTPWEDANPRLKEPKTKMAVLVRRLAERAMSVTHHDASETEPGYIHEVQAMERHFTALLRGKLK